MMNALLGWRPRIAYVRIPYRGVVVPSREPHRIRRVGHGCGAEVIDVPVLAVNTGQKSPSVELGDPPVEKLLDLRRAGAGVTRGVRIRLHVVIDNRSSYPQHIRRTDGVIGFLGSLRVWVSWIAVEIVCHPIIL